jgi:rhamnose transport system ATP-binding protein
VSGNARKPIVELSGITKRFDAVQALRGVELTLVPGEVHALVGENGAGKSTLVKILAGIYQPDAGEITYDGKPVTIHSPLDAREKGIVVIHQHPSLFPDLDVAENMFMGRHPTSSIGRIDWRDLRARVQEALDSLGVGFTATTPVQALSVADRQLVEIAKALTLDAQVLIMDEPTASLSSREVDRLFAIIRQLRSQGVAILFIGHRLEEIFEISDRITVYRDGGHVLTEPTADLSIPETIRAMVGRQLDALFPKEPAEIGKTVLEVRQLTRTGAFEQVSFSLRQGEILGLFGLVGAGRTEIARVIFGVDEPESGEVQIDGRTTEIDSPAAALAAGLAYVPEDRHAEGLILPFPILNNITLPSIRRLSRRGLIDRAQERRISNDEVVQLQVKAAGLNQIVSELSGGNQQKVVIGKWLATNPRILILDEPTRGIDIGTKAEVHRIISQLAGQGLAILMISSELPEILGMSDRVLVMHEGRLVAEFDRASATQEAIMQAATGQVALAEPSPASRNDTIEATP